MESAIVSSKFQVVIPKAIRTKMGITQGQMVAFKSEGGKMRIIAIPPVHMLRGKFPNLRHMPGRKELWGDENR